MEGLLSTGQTPFSLCSVWHCMPALDNISVILAATELASFSCLVSMSVLMFLVLPVLCLAIVILVIPSCLLLMLMKILMLIVDTLDILAYLVILVLEVLSILIL